jgi:hypothetical protein
MGARDRRAALRELRRIRTHSSTLLPVAIALRALNCLQKGTTESSLNLWVPPEPLSWLLQSPLNCEGTTIGRGDHIPAGLSPLGSAVVYRSRHRPLIDIAPGGWSEMLWMGRRRVGHDAHRCKTAISSRR